MSHPRLVAMNRVLLGVKGLSSPEAVTKVTAALKSVKGVSDVNNPHPDTIEVNYDASSLTVMDLIRAIRSQGFPAGMI